MDTGYIDQAIATLQAKKTEWARKPIADKRQLLSKARERTRIVAARWVAAAAKAKSLSPNTQPMGEEWLSGPWAFVALLNALDDTLARLDSGVDVLEGYAIETRPDGRVAVRFQPADLSDRLLFLSLGIDGQVWMEPGINAADVPTAAFYRRGDPVGAVSLVLGAGNIASIPSNDLLFKLYNQGEVVALKFNPVNQYLGEFFEEIFAPFVDGGYVRFIYGGVDVGEYLTQHPGVETIHITGSDRTHDAIVFGRDASAAERKANDLPLLDKPISSELGGVCPAIVVPGAWTDADIRFQAEHIATQRLSNSGFNCLATQVLVLPEGWPQADQLLDAIRTVIWTTSEREPYYPGAGDRHQQAIEAHPGAEVLSGGHAPVTLIPDVDPTDTEDICFTEEFFTATMATTSLPAPTPAAYLENAVEFSNTVLAGTLGANLLIDPRTLKANRSALERAITDLRYGAIAVNAWIGATFVLPRATWGAFPGHTRADIQSGRGIVHNALMFDKPERTVLWGHFRPAPRAWLHGDWHPAPKLPGLITHRRGALVGERMTAQAIDRSLLQIAGVGSALYRP
jgi:aldehyde dehydrogenase (NAD(P)+)